ncbi:MAG: DUF1573 domain-containing protein [Firmicutes bacterium]|nr:DUF1573 domain-containing protein [Bacillota bacterium]MCL5038668.1 DUF1573 domain-containing protein [Bacillota bacterium]
MKDILSDEFQQSVDEFLIRHRSIIDLLTKFQESTARVNRAVAKSVTGCGCIQIQASQQKIPVEVTLKEVRNYMDDHLRGSLCENCREVVEEEIGNHLFYLAALANSLDINLYDILIRQNKKVAALGVFSVY